MKWCHIYAQGEVHLGAQTTAGLVDLTATAARRGMPCPADLQALIAAGREGLRQAQALLSGKPVVWAREAKLAPAVLHPGKILCVGLNYPSHTAEFTMETPEQPVLFSKFSNALAAHDQDIPFPPRAQRLDYEAELVVVVGKGGKHLSEEEAAAHIFGYTAGNDVSERVLQFQSSQWMMGKTWDHFAPVGPYVVTADEIGDAGLEIACRVNGEVRQRANTRDMLFSPARVLAYVSQYLTLEAGDLLFTGTPGGVMQGYPPERQHWLQPGDVVEVSIERIGTLRNRFV